MATVTRRDALVNLTSYPLGDRRVIGTPLITDMSIPFELFEDSAVCKRVWFQQASDLRLNRTLFGTTTSLTRMMYPQVWDRFPFPAASLDGREADLTRPYDYGSQQGFADLGKPGVTERQAEGIVWALDGTENAATLVFLDNAANPSGWSGAGTARWLDFLECARQVSERTKRGVVLNTTNPGVWPVGDVFHLADMASVIRGITVEVTSLMVGSSLYFGAASRTAFQRLLKAGVFVVLCPYFESDEMFCVNFWRSLGDPANAFVSRRWWNGVPRWAQRIPQESAPPSGSPSEIPATTSPS